MRALQTLMALLRMFFLLGRNYERPTLIGHQVIESGILKAIFKINCKDAKNRLFPFIFCRDNLDLLEMVNAFFFRKLLSG